MTNVLITGASGFVGSHLAEALAARACRVTCLVRKTSRVEHLKRLGAGLAFGDVTESAGLARAVAGQDVVYHVAGLVKALRAAELERVNAEGVRRVAEACAAASRPPVLVLVSSLAAAGPAPKGRPRTELDAPAPVSHYGRSKRAGELAAREFAGRVPTTIVRPPIVFGPGDRGCLEWFKGIERFRVHPVPGWRRRTYSLIHVADLAALLVLAAERGERIGPSEAGEDAARGCYFGECGERVTYAEMGRRMAKALGRRVLVWHLAMPVVWTVTAGVELVSRVRGRQHYLNFDKIREAAAGNWTCSSEKAARELGFAPAAPLDERLRETVAWYRREGWL